MQFVSLKFIIFIIFVLCVYITCPEKCRKIYLFLMNIVFYTTFGMKSLIILIIMLLVSYLGGRILAKKKNKKIFLVFLCLSLLPLLILNYSVFLLKHGISFIQPVGLSFFTFKIISYLIEIYKGNVVEKYTLLDYSIYVSFFPTITSGPIDRPQEFLNQIKKRFVFCDRYCIEGILFILWGYFQKMIIADRLAIIVNVVYDDYQNFAGFPLFITSIFYTFQIYFDFAGYTYIALGIAKCLGYECQENFMEPYFSMSIKEFWQRWHISLSSWLRDYIYIPLGGNRKGTMRKYLNIFITFLISGIWHGAGWNYVIWGALHGFYQIVGACTDSYRIHVKEKIGIKGTKLEKGIQIGTTFLLVNFAWIFFRSSDGLKQGLNRIRFMLGEGEIGFSWITKCGVTKVEMIGLLIAFMVVFIVDLCKYKRINLMEKYFSCWLPIRFAVIYIMIFAILLLGIYGPGYDASSFIYFQF